MTATAPLSTGALSQQALASQLSSFPDYRTPAQAPALRHAQVAQTLWGARLRPVMAHESVAGRFACAALSCPATACTGLGEMDAGASSAAYRNPGALENLLCLEGRLEVQYGPALDRGVELGRWDMLSIPSDVKHTLRNASGGIVRFLSVLSAGPALDYSSIFEPSGATHSGVAAEATRALAVRFEDAPGSDVSSAVLEGRLTRFAKLVPYKSDLANTAGIPPQATQMISAGSVYPLIVPEGHSGRSRTAPMYGRQGLYMSIAECAASANDGPPPHAHSDTQESFFVLDGEWSISSGFESECSVAARPYDIVAMPNKVMRTFQNRSDQSAHLLVVIQGPERMHDIVSFSRRVGEEVERRFGRQTIEAFERIRMTFDAEERAG